jgi:hypothetical protein
MRVRLIVSAENAGWVIGKMASRLTDALNRAGAEATLASEPDDAADVNHWMSYAVVSRRAGRASTVFITHIDDPYKTAQLRHALINFADLGLCMSRDTVRALASRGVPEERLWYVLPAFDAPPEPKRIRIAVATRLYDDGRKRESLLLRLASERDLAPFHFEIAGSGWDAVVPRLRDAGASVHWDEGVEDYGAMLESMRTCDYYLYLGMDEGSLGTLDALALGLKTIVTPQGFHLDIVGGMTEAVESYEDLRAVLDGLAEERARRIASVRGWTWEQYAAEHLMIWEALLAGRRDVAAAVQGRGRYPAESAMPAAPGLTRRTWSGYYRYALSPGRIKDGLTVAPALQPLRRLVKRWITAKGRAAPR